MILVTGATGMIGRALVDCLAREGFKVRAHGRRRPELDKLFTQTTQVTEPAKAPEAAGALQDNVELAVADFSSLTADEALRLCQGCTAIVHAAGLVHQPSAGASLYETINVQATIVLAEAARTCGVRQFIFLSSSSVYGNRATSMVDESSTLQGDTPYAASKLQCEEYLRLQPPCASTVILRPALVFGEGDRGNMASLIRQVASGKYFLVGSASARKSLIYAADLANAVLQVIKNPHDRLELYNIANPEPVSVRELSESILIASGKKPVLPSLPPFLVLLAAQAANLILRDRSPLSADRLAKLCRENSVSVSAFQKSYAFQPRFELLSALAREIAWLEQEKASAGK